MSIEVLQHGLRAVGEATGILTSPQVPLPHRLLPGAQALPVRRHMAAEPPSPRRQVMAAAMAPPPRERRVDRRERVASLAMMASHRWPSMHSPSGQRWKSVEVATQPPSSTVMRLAAASTPHPPCQSARCASSGTGASWSANALTAAGRRDTNDGGDAGRPAQARGRGHNERGARGSRPVEEAKTRPGRSDNRANCGTG
jgi:hypothetical protein